MRVQEKETGNPQRETRTAQGFCLDVGDPFHMSVWPSYLKPDHSVVHPKSVGASFDKTTKRPFVTNQVAADI